ncbi:hypothetical protein OH77DRAFT_1418341 [Trametes cingulata]|nr:hypothetical protein OH77DRAFT_1418341 [Trametes cingulata]
MELRLPDSLADLYESLSENTVCSPQQKNPSPVARREHPMRHARFTDSPGEGISLPHSAATAGRSVACATADCAIPADARALSTARRLYTQGRCWRVHRRPCMHDADAYADADAAAVVPFSSNLALFGVGRKAKLAKTGYATKRDRRSSLLAFQRTAA